MLTELNRKYKIEFIYRIGDIVDIDSEKVTTYKNMKDKRNVMLFEKLIKEHNNYDYVGIYDIDKAV